MSKDRQERAARAEQMRKEREKAAKRQRNLITAAIVAVVLVLIGLAAYGVSSINKDNAPKAWNVTYTPEDAGATVAPDYEPVVVELYEDFQCPACQALETAFGQQLKDMVSAGDITLKFHPFSFLDERGGSPNDYSKRATNAAICVYEEYDSVGYVQFHDYLYANQPQEGSPGPEDEDLAAAADSLGFTGLESCITEHTYFDRIAKAKEAGGDRGVTGTPSIFIEGTKVEDNSTLIEQIQAAVAEKRGTEAPAPVPAPTDAPTATTPAG